MGSIMGGMAVAFDAFYKFQCYAMVLNLCA